ncbi:GMC family oxidoreductase [Actinoplanes sp. NPDC051513]|uniref:GMC family oxidoreductase n=1 Tax=Actinoplanes sp. NPDC051513 TaxID=3363908 RepID=UPI00379B91A1
MERFDYVVVGAGPAGCVLARRLSAEPATTVLLIEAGDHDTNPLIAMPRGYAELLGDPEIAWHYPIRPFDPAGQREVWVRGRTLGGSSSVNGLVYNRGGRADYDELEALGNAGWGWDDLLPAFIAIEDHDLGATATRGAGGPLHVSAAVGDPLLEDVIAAGESLGWRRSEDYNETDDERIGYAMATIRDGRRHSAADAFLHPVEDRSNLTVSVRTTVDRVVLDGGAAVGVQGRRDGRPFEAAGREVILAAGAISTPAILQRSGIGPVETLRSAGVEVVVDSPNVGGRLREHRVAMLQFRLVEDVGYNRLLEPEEGRAAAMREWLTSGGGPLGAPSFNVVGFFRTRHGLDRPDAQIQIAPFSLRPYRPGEALQVEREPGMACVAFALRPESEGSVSITSADPDAVLDIDPGYLTTEHDRRTTVDLVRGVRRLFAQAPLAARIKGETMPGPESRSDREILDAALTYGSAGYHAIATCAMGPADDDVVDSRLRVRGVRGLRVVDASVLPVMVSGNLNGPVSALAWRAADLILEGN